jgi:hypothetical protein
LTYNYPVFIKGAFNGAFKTFFNDWMTAADSWELGADTGTDTSYLNTIKQSTGWRGAGRYPTLQNPDDTTFTGSVLTAQKLGNYMVIGPCNIQWLNTNNLTSSTVTVQTNDEFRAIWHDAAASPGWQISSNNSTGEVWGRYMANGDIVVAMINRTAGTVTLSASWKDLKISPTNTLMVCRDVYERTNSVQASALTRSCRANEGSLWRLTPVASPGKLYGNGSPEGSVAAPVGWIYQQLDGSGTTYMKTNGVDRTGWYDTLLRTHG